MLKEISEALVEVNPTLQIVENDYPNKYGVESPDKENFTIAVVRLVKKLVKQNNEELLDKLEAMCNNYAVEHYGKYQTFY